MAKDRIVAEHVVKCLQFSGEMISFYSEGFSGTSKTALSTTSKGGRLNEKTVFDERLWSRNEEVVARFHCLKSTAANAQQKAIISSGGNEGKIWPVQLDKRDDTNERFNE